ncbi:GDP-mannose 4,6-dehydratase [Flavobacteriaceae bacterium]|nr:GDP-mannose 4,6-dehydratase [Flavobacteriaceae bacterium]MDB2695242.1 GDP-mannose 4,6-dehydratase [Flavobacteriaceae bacterium]MDC6478611.1 GDP-mannose 4,6-dehydratase [Flavobacteriaceae bacterium]
MKSAIIFGASGQDGYLLNNILINNKVTTHLVSRNNSPIKGDVSNYDFVSNLINSIKPDYIFHFAATSSVSHEFLFENHSSISLGTINVLESVKTYSKESKIFIAGSAEQFENNGEPINEFSPFKANSTYSAERIYATHISRYFREKHSVQVYNGYFFHHDSPLRSNNHLNQRIINFVKDLSLESKVKFRIGDYNIQKEFNYSEDFMEAVWLLINQNSIYEVVIGSGKPYPISDWLELAFAKRNLDWRDWIEVDKDFQKPYEKLFSDPSLMKSLGWESKTGMGELLNLMY